MHYKDLELCRYHSGPFDADSWCVPLYAIGWLEDPHPFLRGAAHAGLLERLRALVANARALYSQYYFRGVHDCSICLAEQQISPGPPWSQENIFVPGVDVVYVAPGGIIHYVEAHAYVPPQQFVEAVLACPDYGSPEYEHALRASNAGNAPPLRTFAEEIAASRMKFVKKGEPL